MHDPETVVALTDQARPRLTWSEYVWSHPALAVGVFIAMYGVQTSEVDKIDFRTISAAPFTINLPPEHQLLYGSPFTFLVGAYYQHHGLDYLSAFYVVHLLGVAFFLISLRTALFHAFGDEGGRLGTIVMLSSPLLLVVLSWIGKSDPYLLAFFFLFTVTSSRVTQVIFGVLMILCHRELGAFVLVAYWCLKRERSQTIALGLVLGEIGLLAYTHVWLSAAPMSRTMYALDHASDLWHVFWAHPALHLLTSFGPFWMYVITRKTLTWTSVAVLLAAMALAATTYDFTRIFVIVSTPLLLEVTRDAVADIRRHGSISVGNYRLPMQTLWPLIFLQIQIVQSKLLWARGVEFVLG